MKLHEIDTLVVLEISHLAVDLEFCCLNALVVKPFDYREWHSCAKKLKSRKKCLG